MATKVILPKLGQTMEEGIIVEWLKKEGDLVNRGDVLFQVESDKAVLEVEARVKGVLRKILAGKGAKVPVLTVVGIIAQPDEEIGDLLAGDGQESAEEEGPDNPAPQAAAQPSPGAETRESGRIFASPRARKLARGKNLDIATLEGTGPGGRIIEKDVLAYLARQPLATAAAQRVAAKLGVRLDTVPSTGARISAAEVLSASQPASAVDAQESASASRPEGEVRPMSSLQAIVAERMAASAHTAAAVTLQSGVDATELVALRARLREALDQELGFSLTYNDLLGIMVARCLVDYPYMNVQLDLAGIRHIEAVNLGIAVDTERGLLVPTIRGADKLGIKAFAIQAHELIARAREGRCLPDELTGGTFTITNLGMLGVDLFTPIINLPECAILGVGRIRPEPAVLGGEVVVRQRMWLSLTFDHRLVDGAPAARFFQALMRTIETPLLLLA